MLRNLAISGDPYVTEIAEFLTVFAPVLTTGRRRNLQCSEQVNSRMLGRHKGGDDATLDDHEPADDDRHDGSEDGDNDRAYEDDVSTRGEHKVAVS